MERVINEKVISVYNIFAYNKRSNMIFMTRKRQISRYLSLTKGCTLEVKTYRCTKKTCRCTFHFLTELSKAGTLELVYCSTQRSSN